MCRELRKGNLALNDRGIEPLDVFADETPVRSNRTRFMILSAVVVLALGYMIYAAFPGNALYFLTVSEFNDNLEVKDLSLIHI